MTVTRDLNQSLKDCDDIKSALQAALDRIEELEAENDDLKNKILDMRHD